MRDQHIWMASLRGRVKHSKEIGLRELIMKGNKLGAETIRAISPIIAIDEYIRVIDLRNNLIPEEVLREDLVPAFKQNKTLTNLDLRENPGYTIKARRMTALCMLRNIDRLKKAVPPVENIGKHWLNPKVLLPPQDAVSLIDSHMLDTVNFDDT